MIAAKFLQFIILWSLLSCWSSVNNESSDQQPKPSSQNKEVVCFVYHRFGDDRFPTTNITIRDFEAQLKFLKDHGYSVITMSAALQYLRDPSPERKVVVLTVDDAYKSFFQNGWPILKKYNFPATIYVNTSTVGASDYMNWTELTELTKANVEIGNHTHSHSYFLNLNKSTRYEVWKEEIQQCQSLLKKHLNIQPNTFAYPYGEFDEQMKDIVRIMGFIGATAQNSGVLSTRSNPYQIPRFPMSETYSNLQSFKEKLNMHSLQIEAEKPYTRVISSQNLSPELQLKIKSDSLDLDRIQCFIQGNECNLLVDHSTNPATLKIKPVNPLANRRRTLYTITVPDLNGDWHWYSHLWINPTIK